MEKIRFILIFISMATFFSCNQSLLVPGNPNKSREDFEVVWNTVKSTYPYLEFKKIDWDSIYTVYGSRVEQAKDRETLTALIDMLKELKDHHVLLKTEKGKIVQPYMAPRVVRDRYTFSLSLVKKYFGKNLRTIPGGKINYGILREDIGYIHFSTFKSAELLKDFSYVMKYMKHTKSLIIDIRHNTGGLCNNVYKIVRWFLESPIEHPDYYVLGGLHNTPSIQPGGDFQYLEPVVIIINGVCFSSGEFFAEIMKQIPTVTVVGDTTGGGSSGTNSRAPGEFLLPSGKKIHISTVDMRRYDGLPWEWYGIDPDIFVLQTEKDVRLGRDNQLEFAINLLKQLQTLEFNL